MYFEIKENGKVLENGHRRIRLSELEFGAKEFERMFGDRDVEELETNDRYKEIFKTVPNSEYSTMSERIDYLAHKRKKFHLEEQYRYSSSENSKARGNASIDEEKIENSLEFLQKMDEYNLIINNEEKMKQSGLISFFKETFGSEKPVPEEIQALFKKEDGTLLTEQELEEKKERLLEEARGYYQKSKYNHYGEEPAENSTLEWTYSDKIHNIERVMMYKRFNNKSALNITEEVKQEYKNYIKEIKEEGRQRVESTNKQMEELQEKIDNLDFPKDLEKKIDNEIELAFMAESDYHYAMYDRPQKYDSTFTSIYRATIHKDLEKMRLEQPNNLNNENSLENGIEMPKGKHQMQPDVPSIHIKPKKPM